MEFTVNLTGRASATATVVIEADDEDEAEQKALGLDDVHWSFDDPDDFEVSDVEADKEDPDEQENAS